MDLISAILKKANSTGKFENRLHIILDQLKIRNASPAKTENYCGI